MDVDDDGICCSTSATNEQQSFFKEKEQVMIYIHTLTSYDCTKEDSNTDVTFEDLSLLQAYEGAAMIVRVSILSISNVSYIIPTHIHAMMPSSINIKNNLNS